MRDLWLTAFGMLVAVALFAIMVGSVIALGLSAGTADSDACETTLENTPNG